MYEVWDRSTPGADLDWEKLLSTQYGTVQLQEPTLIGRSYWVHSLGPFDSGSRPWLGEVIEYTVWDRSTPGAGLDWEKWLCVRSGTVRLQEPALFGTKVIVYMVWYRSTPGVGLDWDKINRVHSLGPFGSGSRFCFGQKLLCTRSGSVRLRESALFGTKLLCTQSGSVRLQDPASFRTKGSLSRDDGNENVTWKYNFIPFVLPRDYFYSLNFYRNGELSRNQIGRSGVQVTRKKMKNSPSCAHVL